MERRASTKVKISAENFKEIKEQFLFDLKAVVEVEEILTISSSTGIKLVSSTNPVCSWTMEKKGSNRVEIAGIYDKRQITAVFAASLAGDFLPVQLVSDHVHYTDPCAKCCGTHPQDCAECVITFTPVGHPTPNPIYKHSHAHSSPIPNPS